MSLANWGVLLFLLAALTLQAWVGIMQPGLQKKEKRNEEEARNGKEERKPV